jgi:hypothetical protein
MGGNGVQGVHLRRLQLFEWEDQPWLPTPIRDFITDHLRYTSNERMRHPVNLAMAERLMTLLRKTGQRRIVDLCAGGGGPLPDICRIFENELGYPVEILLTDLYPNARAFRQLEAESGGRIKARYDSTSAFDVPADLDGVRTVFTAFHHFKPEDARLILGDAVRKRAPIAVFEPLERTVRCVALVGVMSLLRGFTHTPRLGSLTRARLLLTYVLPIAPAVFAWDGMVSALRSYNSNELRDLAFSITGDGYRWEWGRFDVRGPYGSMPTTYLIGFPE